MKFTYSSNFDRNRLQCASGVLKRYDKTAVGLRSYRPTSKTIIKKAF